MTGGSIAFDDERFVYSYAGGSVGQYMSGTYYDGSGLTQRFYINNSEQMRLTSTGLGIGTSSPNYVATLYKASLPVLQFVNSTSGSTAGDGLLMYLNGANATISNEEVGSINFQTSGLLRATLDASGNLGLGVTPSAWGTSEYKAVQVGIGASFYGRVTAGDQDKAGVSSNAFNNGTNWLYIATDSAANYTQIGGGHFFYTAASGTAGDSITFTQAMTLDASGNLGVGTTSPGARVDVRGSATDFDGLRIINTSGNSGVATKASLRLGITNSIGIRNTKIQAIEDSADDNGVSLAFFTNSANALDSEVERARITSGGDLLVGTTSAIQASRFGVLAGSSTNCIAAQNTNNNNYLYTGTNSSNTEVFRVAGSGDVLNTNNSYGALSDSKLKENITDATSKLEKLNQVRVVNFNMIGSEHKQIGVIAQELEQVFPGMVDETPDRDQEGNGLGTTTKSVKYSVFVPMLIKAMQELKAEFDAYKASHP